MNETDRSELKVLASKIDTLEAKVDLLLERSATMKDILRDHEARIRKNESWRYGMPATLIMSGFAFAAVLLKGVSA